MAQRAKDYIQRISTPKRSSTSGNSSMVKTSSMNKSKTYKAYRGQGR
jgi:hypothetical protein